MAVLVPGMSNELDDVPALTREARRLAAAAGPGTAVVAWLGYDAPNVRQVISDGRAKSGAQQLQRFILGLRSTAARLQHVTVLGHSYGSLVAGLAAKAPGADDLVLLASPGWKRAAPPSCTFPPGTSGRPGMRPTHPAGVLAVAAVGDLRHPPAQRLRPRSGSRAVRRQPRRGGWGDRSQRLLRRRQPVARQPRRDRQRPAQP